MQTTNQNRMKKANEIDTRAPAPVIMGSVTPLPAPERLGVRCPNKACGNRRSKVLDTYMIKNGKARIRRRQCESCGFMWSTQEA